MKFIDDIYSLVWDISDFFKAAYLTASDWLWPFSLLQYPLFSIYLAVWDLLAPIAEAGKWLSDLSDSIAGFFNEAGILKLLKKWINYAELTWAWIIAAVQNVGSIISSWWTGTSAIVLGWIDAAKIWAKTLIDAVATSLAGLQATWDEFWTVTFPSLATWAGVGELVESTLKSWLPFYNTLIELWDEIEKFFVDPQQYVYDKLDEWFERFW